MHALAKTDAADRHYLETELRNLIASGTGTWDFLQQGSLDGVWYWDLENPDSEWMSPEFWTLLGIDPATKGHSPAEWQDLIFEEDLATALDNFQRHCQDPNHAYDQVVRYRHADGSTVWVRCRGMAIRDETGRPIRMLGAHNDLTAAKRAEQEANVEKAKLQLANEELTAFAYGVSHDLKSPSRIALQLVEEGLLVDDGNITEEQRELFEGAIQTLERMQILISDLLDYGVLVDQKAPEEAVDVTDVVADVLADIKPVVSDANGRLHIGALPVIKGYRSQFRMLVQNLIMNALTYRRDGVPPVIKITSHVETNGTVSIHFEDNACGIPESQLEKIFGVFTRLYRHDEIEGSGLGLAVCKRVALNHNGMISVSSTVGQGSMFTLSIPYERHQA